MHESDKKDRGKVMQLLSSAECSRSKNHNCKNNKLFKHTSFQPLGTTVQTRKQLHTKATSTRTERKNRPTKQFHFGNNFLVPYGHFIGLIRLLNLMQLKAVSTAEKFRYGEAQ